ncbi:hypothetical protein [Actinoplanes palleronii]|uniref:Uncharacterized protein n=1 Tax=Actinoplanes palleronii TaxID=113570 RepID=A0ABQ4BK57_9ACTN|nr:hypothetical protein [Actinoplanes palleronii]GIE70676.1 hypothetical protein Apa02nite_067840 [Actinoplanes palleronii]
MHDTDYATTWLPDPTGAAVLRLGYRLTGATGVVQRVLEVAGVLDLAHPPAG